MTTKKTIISICVISLALILGVVAYLLFNKKDVIDHIPAKAKAVVMVSPSNEETGEDIKQLLNNVLELKVEGLDFSNPSYVFITPNEYYGIAISVSDAEKITQSFSKGKIEENDGAQWLWYNDSWQLCWTDDVFLALGPSTIEDQAHIKRTLSIMIDASADEGFGHTERYKQMIANEGDIHIFSKLDVIPLPYGLPFKMSVPDTCEADNVLIYANAKYDNGKWIADCNITSGDQNTLQLMQSAEKRQNTISLVEPEGVGSNNLLYIAGNADYGQLYKQMTKENTLQMLFASFNDSTDVKKRIKEMEGGFSFCIENIDENLHAACLLSGKSRTGEPIVLESKQKLSASAFAGEKVSEQVKGLQYYFCLNFEPLKENKAIQEKYATVWRLLGNIKNVTYKSAESRKATIEIETYQK